MQKLEQYFVFLVGEYSLFQPRIATVNPTQPTIFWMTSRKIVPCRILRFVDKLAFLLTIMMPKFERGIAGRKALQAHPM